MKLLIFSDIHTDWKTLEDLLGVEADYYIAAGDQLTWSSISGKTYRVLATSDIATSFVPVSGVVTAAGPTAAYLGSPATNSARFYRVNALP